MSFRSRSQPWWERCDVLGHTPCDFCLAREQREARYAKSQLIVQSYEPAQHLYWLFPSEEFWGATSPPAGVDRLPIHDRANLLPAKFQTAMGLMRLGEEAVLREQERRERRRKFFVRTAEELK